MKIFRQITANDIELSSFPFRMELAMESYLIENESILSLDSEDFSEVNVIDAEIALKGGRKTSNKDGRIDILASYGIDYLSIVELKLGQINEEALLQLEDYLVERNQILEKFPEFWEDSSRNPKWVGVLVGTSISPELQRKLEEGYIFGEIPIAGLVMTRYRSLDNQVYVVTDTFFKYNYSNKDYSKFKFKNKEYNKSRLVNEVIRTYVENNPLITYSNLETIFPRELQGKGVFDTYEMALEVFNTTGYKRHYLKPNELIELKDSRIATSTQWGVGNIFEFINHVNSKLGNNYKIENI